MSSLANKTQPTTLGTRMGGRRRRIRAIGVAAIVVVLTACVETDDGGATTSELTAPTALQVQPVVVEPSGSDLADIESLFRLSQYSPRAEEVLHESMERVTSECMVKAGFAYVVVPYVHVVGENRNAIAMFPSLPTPAEVSKSGFRSLFPGFSQPVGTDLDAVGRSNRVQVANDPNFAQALFGDGGSVFGCVAHARDRVAQVVELNAREEWRALAPGVATALDVTAALSDPRLEPVLAIWRTCMSGHGFGGQSDPFAAARSFPNGSMAGGSVSVAEADLAGADLLCRIESGFREQLLAVVAERGREWMTANEAEVAHLRATTASEAQRIVDTLR